MTHKSSEDVLEKAIKCHKCDDLNQAKKYYRQAIKEDIRDPRLYMNVLSILRKEKDYNDALMIAKKALNIFPDDAGLLNNIGNIYMDIGKDAQALDTIGNALKARPDYLNARLTYIELLWRNECYSSAITMLRDAFQRHRGIEEVGKVFIFGSGLIGRYGKKPSFEDKWVNIFAKNAVKILEMYSGSEKIQALMLMAHNLSDSGSVEKAIEYYNLAEQYISKQLTLVAGSTIKPKFKELWSVLCWNLSLSLIKRGEFETGWRLYDHGLRVPAKGAQKWQRSLKKPFSNKSISAWRGEILKGKSILVLGEQGIGDTMMFATLLPSLIKEGAKIHFLPGDRLYSMYKRSMPEVNILMLEHVLRLDPSKIDFQVPIATICRHRFSSLDKFKTIKPFLNADNVQTKELRDKYEGISDGKLIVGISWQGGGRKDRIKDKSIDFKQLVPVLDESRFTFISLQYGKAKPFVDKYNELFGLNVVCDESVDAMTDMDRWLAQCAAVDAVISIANTTIHGAAGLKKPTFCLLSQYADWRWLEPELEIDSYWYDTVVVGRQSTDGSWSSALNAADCWLQKISNTVK